MLQGCSNWPGLLAGQGVTGPVISVSMAVILININTAYSDSSLGSGHEGSSTEGMKRDSGSVLHGESLAQWPRHSVACARLELSAAKKRLKFSS
jgi:hypothetical protein